MPKALSERAHRKILEAALELFAERGIDAASIDAIAAAAGVSKATVYNHWADKEALAMEVLTQAYQLDEGPPEPDSGDLAADVLTFLEYEPPARLASLHNRLTPHLIAYSVRNPDFGKAWRARAMERNRSILKRMLRRGIDRGVFPPVLDEDLGVALLLGPMMYRHIFANSIDRKWLAAGAVQSFWRAYARPLPDRPKRPGRG